MFKSLVTFTFFVTLSCFSAIAVAGYTAVYTPSKTRAELALAKELRESQAIEKIAAIVNKYVNVSPEIPIVAASCGQSNAYYVASKKTVVLCYEFLTDNAKRLKNSLGHKLPTNELSKILASELAFVLLHEVGHSLIDLYQLPVLGKEEDAADQFAAFMLLSTDGANVLKNATLFFHLNKPDWLSQIINAQARYGDAHALEQQRIANLACWGFGKAPQEFRSLVLSIKLPPSRLNRCAGEFSKMDKDIRGLLGSNLTIDQSSMPADVIAVNQAQISKIVPVASEPETTVCNPHKHAVVPNIFNNRYSAARNKLIQAGWQPSRVALSGREPPAGRSHFFDRGYFEVEDCSGSGMANCIFRFTDIYKNNLVVVTTGEDNDPRISKYHFECIPLHQ